MSKKEYDRLSILKQDHSRQLQEKTLTQVKAAELLRISDRQIRNLLVSLKANGAKGLISKKRGQPSNYKYRVSVKEETLRIIRSQYEDFGPTLAMKNFQKCIKSIFREKLFRRKKA